MRSSWIVGAVLTLVWAWLAASVETSVVFRLPQLAASVSPCLVATLSAALFVNPVYGVRFAFITGVLCDIALGNAVGLRSIPLVLCAAAVGMAQDRLSREHPLAWALLGFVGSLLHDIVFFGVLGLIGYLPLLYSELARVALVGALANSVLSLICLTPVYLWWRTDRKPFPDGLD